MISLTAASYILVSTIVAHGNISQTTATFADKPSCESAATRQDFVYRDMNFGVFGRWNLTCHPYSLTEDRK